MFIPAQLHLSAIQMKNLSQGCCVRVKHDALNHSCDVHLTPEQYKKITSATKTGRGLGLMMDAQQLQHHRLRGSGRFADFLRDFKDGVKWGANTLRDEAVSSAIGFVPEAVETVASMARPTYQQITQKLPVLQPFSDMGADLAKKYSIHQIQSLIHGLHSSQYGSGIFGSIKDFFGSGMSAGGALYPGGYRDQNGNGLYAPGYHGQQ